jgi:hypothetical protein
VALRVAPFAGPFAQGDTLASVIVDVAKQLLDDSAAHGVKIEEYPKGKFSDSLRTKSTPIFVFIID